MRRDSGNASGGAWVGSPQAELFVSCTGCRALHRPECELAFNQLCASCRGSGTTDSPAIGHFHVLTAAEVAGAVGETSAGTYALGYLDGSSFTVFYVGRSDSDVNASLLDWVDAPSHPRRHRSSPQQRWRSQSGPRLGLGTRALGHTPIGIDTSYTHFAFRYAPSPLAAFERECRDYHELGGDDVLDNRRHPTPPQGSPWACPMHG